MPSTHHKLTALPDCVVRSASILIFLLLFSSFSFAQDKFPPPYVVVTDTADTVNLSHKYWQYLGDNDAGLKLNDVLSPAKRKLFNYTVANREFPKRLHTLWLRYRLRNALDRPVSIAIAENGIDRAEVNASINGGKWVRYVTGERVPWRERSGLKQICYIVLVIPAHGELTVYERNYVEVGLLSVAVAIGFRDRVVSEQYVDNDARFTIGIFEGTMIGFLLFAALFNLFVFFAIKERIYVIYAVFLLALLLTTTRHAALTFIVRDQPGVVGYYSLVSVVMLYTLLYTIRYFLNIKKHYPRWNKILNVTSIVAIAIIVLERMVITPLWKEGILYADTVAASLLLGMVPAIAVTMVLVLVKKDASARIFALALGPFLLTFAGIIIGAVAGNIAILDTANWLFRLAMTGSLFWGISVMSWSLFDRFRRVSNENAQRALDAERMARERDAERSELIAAQKVKLEQEVEERTAELKRSMEELRQTQNQLIQSEKMASLGELTAGIAHEIQNPLNFVNNFSEVSAELVKEIKEGIENREWTDVSAIADDLELNLEKITHHGKRADNIVKGMLQHSRASTGQKELTDLNALAEEYLRLSYHGIRAKDKSFNAELVTDFDAGLPKVNVIPQDFGRVLLNLFNNAFQATQQKKFQEGEQYHPQVTVTTRQVAGGVEIRVGDNGPGIPDGIKDKIFQPFFTTKATGEGTGLGLSLSYDIVTKGHGGTIGVENRDGGGAVFVVGVK
ncbi:sensor histidine kinase [Hufsiella ginkgonis]|uniref:histidine kinase n=1 Tax=Hufsiella ginkgonis TaxID=2695274 RepID=A0A7K1XUV9_9SPHI|nr:ATP-binding protein [Hufsiella ginkgonis]MXV14795.1 hypothetical protein [Hufsiella ginkgonis]